MLINPSIITAQTLSITHQTPSKINTGARMLDANAGGPGGNDTWTAFT